MTQHSLTPKLTLWTQYSAGNFDRNWRAKLEKYLLENGQNYIASAARRIWLNILKEGALVKRANGSRTPPAPMNCTFADLKRTRGIKTLKDKE